MNGSVSWSEDVISFLLLEDAPEQRGALCSAGSVLLPALFPPIITSFIAPGLHPSQDIIAASSPQSCPGAQAWSLPPCGSLSSSLHWMCSPSPRSQAFSTSPTTVSRKNCFLISKQSLPGSTWGHLLQCGFVKNHTSYHDICYDAVSTWVCSSGILHFCRVEHRDLSGQQQPFSLRKERLGRHDKRLPTKPK